MTIIDDLKNTTNTEPSMDDPNYEDDKLGATMMDVDVAKLNKGTKTPENPSQPKKEEKEESVDELLKKQKSIIGRIGNIFGKK